MSVFWSLVKKYWSIQSDLLPNAASVIVFAHTYGVDKRSMLIPATKTVFESAVSCAKSFGCKVITCNDKMRDYEAEQKRKEEVAENFSFTDFISAGNATNTIDEVDLALKYLAEQNNNRSIIVFVDILQGRRARYVWKILGKGYNVYMQTVDVNIWPANNPNHWQGSRFKWLLWNVLTYCMFLLFGLDRFRNKQVGISRKKHL